MLGAPGDENFALALTDWSMGINAWDFGYNYYLKPPHTVIYMYTDRPMYRPGQTVYFRGVVRQAFNGRYELPPVNEVPVTLHDGNGVQLLSINAHFRRMVRSAANKIIRCGRARVLRVRQSPLEFYLGFRWRSIANLRST